MDAELAKQTVLIVDDTPENIMLLDEVLRADYNILAATNGEKALKLANSDMPPDIILLDVMMPGMDGFEVCRRLKKNAGTAKIPVVFVTAMGQVQDEAQGFALGAVDYIHKPVSPPLVQARVHTHLALYDQKRALEDTVRQRTVELSDTRLEIIRQLGRAAEFKDNETGLHVIRMSYYSQVIGLASGMERDEADLLLNASPMHDIGKIGIPDSVLLKPGKLDDEEWKIMRRHPEMGAAILGDHPSLLIQTARVIALTHHEKWNGTGYPKGTAGEEIPMHGRITAIADVFDALTSERPYKKAWSVDDAVALIKKEAGSHFDPQVVGYFCEALPEIVNCKNKYSDRIEA